jgi:signal recognition particle subunit SRP54
MVRFEAIVRSMTPRERRNPEIVNGARRKRIATGAGVAVQDVNNTLNRFEQMRQLMRSMASGKLPGMGGMPPMRMPGAPGGGKKQKKGKSGRFKPPFAR